MARIAGVKTQKDDKCNATHATINVKKHHEAVPLLKELGLMGKTQFEKDCEKGITIEKAREHTHAFIRTLPWKK